MRQRLTKLERLAAVAGAGACRYCHGAPSAVLHEEWIGTRACRDTGARGGGTSSRTTSGYRLTSTTNAAVGIVGYRRLSCRS
jgi:hypothetical protein